MSQFESRFELRYVFIGQLIFTTALHIGGGKASLVPTDSPVIRGANMKPFIPGSSLKGCFRCTVEKIASAIGLNTCGLLQNAPCPGAAGATQKDFNKRKEQQNWSEEKFVETLSKELCSTCKLFGSSYQASRIYFDDLPLVSWAGVTQIRDGVAIDRDSEKAVDKHKYDYEVVPPGASFRFQVMVEEPSDIDLSLTCIGLSEFVSGLGNIGGKRSSGLGRCELKDLKIYELDLREETTRAEKLKKYLLGKTLEQKMSLIDTDNFLQKHIDKCLSVSGRDN